MQREQLSKNMCVEGILCNGSRPLLQTHTGSAKTLCRTCVRLKARELITISPPVHTGALPILERKMGDHKSFIPSLLLIH